VPFSRTQRDLKIGNLGSFGPDVVLQLQRAAVFLVHPEFILYSTAITQIMKQQNCESTNIKNKEAEYWDYWNTKTRSGVIDPNSYWGRLRTFAHQEVNSLPVVKPSVIEIGCGTGWLAEGLVGIGSYLGLDLSPKAIEEAQTRVPGARFLAADVLQWDPQGERFDVVLFIDALTSFRDQPLAIAKIFDLLQPGGYLVLASLNPFVFSRISWVGAPGEGQVRKWVTRSDLRAMLQSAGFRVVKFFTKMRAGDKGILRILNSPKLNRLAQIVIPEAWITSAMEGCGLGQFFIVVAQRPI
jgi:ubiquinone/menaquinone biosynthesis C-methylase UbiE